MTFYTLMFVGNIVRLCCFWSDTAANYPQMKTWLVNYLPIYGHRELTLSWGTLHNSSGDSKAGKKKKQQL